MILGDVLAHLQNDGEATELILGLGDLSLLASAQRCAEGEGVDLATYARCAVHRYAVEANDEEWVSAMGALGRTSDPGAAFLKRALGR